MSIFFFALHRQSGNILRLIEKSPGLWAEEYRPALGVGGFLCASCACQADEFLVCGQLH
jgi:hypothetical protein